MIRSVRFLPLSFAATLTAANFCSAQSYTVTDLGASVYTAKAINSTGQIVGAALPRGRCTWLRAQRSLYS